MKPVKQEELFLRRETFLELWFQRPLRLIPQRALNYMAWQQKHNLCNLQLTTVNTIFFFPEVWDEVREVLLATDRKSKLGEGCKKLAARDKRPQQRATVRIVKENQTTSGCQNS